MMYVVNGSMARLTAPVWRDASSSSSTREVEFVGLADQVMAEAVVWQFAGNRVAGS